MIQPISSSNYSASIAIVIPARYASTRFPGKPLAKIGHKTMLAHTCHTAQKAKAMLVEQSDITVKIIVATEDVRIFEHAKTLRDITPVMTSDTCLTGSDRVLAALDVLNFAPDIVLNLQGDAPFTPEYFLTEIISALINKPEYPVATAAVKLTWDELDILRANKITTPFSGTTVVLNAEQEALWFSKNIIPALRPEQKLRAQNRYSPVYQHIGLYGFRLTALKTFVSLPESHYEKLEGLEQLRILENNMKILTQIVSYGGREPIAGVDTPEDLERVTQSLQHTGLLD